MPRGSNSQQPPQNSDDDDDDDARTHLLPQHTGNRHASGSTSNMSAAASNEHGYGTVKHGDVEDGGKPLSGEEVREAHEDDGPASETSSVHLQDGVKRVEVITTVWSKNTMIVMFIL